MRQDTRGVDFQALSDTELIALAREAQKVIESQGESNELHVLFRDFAKELLRRRVLAKVEFVRLMEVSRPE
jgi:hypothetical protein